VVNRGSEEMTVAHDFRKQSKLVHRASALTLQALEGQAGFGMRSLDQFVSNVQNVIRDSLEESRALRERRIPICIEGCGRERSRLFDFLRTTHAERWFSDVRIGRWIERELAALGSTHSGKTD